LLGQAAARSDGLLSSLIASLTAPSITISTTDTDISGSATPDTAVPSIAFLNEPSNPSLQTPLHLAILTGNTANVTLLLSHGASVHARDILSHSPLFYALRLGLKGREMVGELKKAGGHLGEGEIGSGEVGLEWARIGRSADGEVREMWEEAVGVEVLGRAEEVLRRLVVG